MSRFVKFLVIILMIPLFSYGEGETNYFYENFEKSEIEETTVESVESDIEKINTSSGGKKAQDQIFNENATAFFSWSENTSTICLSKQPATKTQNRLFILYCSLRLHA